MLRRAPSRGTRRGLVRGAASSRSAARSELLELAAEHGLDHAADALAGLAIRSARLTLPANSAAASVDLARATAILPSEMTGHLLIEAGEEPGDVALEIRRRLHRPVAPSARLSGELVLPRAWSTAVERLGLTFEEQSRWEALREALALGQGTHHTGDPRVAPVHRLLGVPDERHGDMPLECELRARDVLHEPGGARTHPLADELTAPSERWMLLLQLTWAAGLRTYCWIDRADFAAGDLTRVQVIVR